jgi:hypothetical protein
MKSRRMLFCTMVAWMAGCVPVLSLHPLYTAQTLTFDERLLGTWIEDANEQKSTWQFSRLDPADQNTLPDGLKDQRDRVYRLTLEDGAKRKGVFTACIVKLENRLFLDLFPAGFPSGAFKDVEKSEFFYNAFCLVPAHMFFKVDEIGNQLKIRMTVDDMLKRLVEAEPAAIKYETVNDQTILTASTKELQAFFTKYANDERLFGDKPLALSRKPSK